MLTWGPALLLWLGALHLHKETGLPPAAAHLCLLLTALLALCAAAMLNVLFGAAAVLLAGCLLSTLADIRREGPQAWCAGARAFLTRPVVLALAAGAVLTAVFALQQPAFTYWDEFYIAGINAKVTQLSNLLYTVAESPARATEDPCGPAVLSYLYQFFSRNFSEGDLYLSYGYFYFAVFAAAAEQVERRGAGRRAGSVFFMALALTPLLQNYHAFSADYSAISYGYISALPDYMLAVGMLACAALYLAAPSARWYWAALLFTAFMKESGVLFAAVAAVALAVWRAPRRGAGRGAWPRWLGGTALDVAVASAGYLVWLMYRQVCGSGSAVPGLAAAALLAAAAVLWRALGAGRRARCRAAAARFWAKWARWLGLTAAAVLAAALAVLGRSGGLGYAVQRIGEAGRILGGIFVPALRSEGWQNTLDMEVHSFFHERLLYPLPDWGLVALLTLLVLAALALERDRARGVRVLLVHAALGLCAVAYLITMAYFVTHHVETLGMMEYGRYFTGYLFGWVYLLLLLLLSSPGKAQWQQILALAWAVFCVGATASMGLDHTAAAAPENYRRQDGGMRCMAAQAATALQPGDRVYLVIEKLDSFSGLAMGHMLYPALVNCPKVDTQLDYNVLFCTARDPADPYADRYYLATPAEFAANIQRNFDYVLVSGDDGDYARDYGALFEGGLEVGALYRVTQDTDVPFRRVPV